MKIDKLTVPAVFLALGTLLNMFVPGIINGMKPDFILMSAFFGVLYCLDNFGMVTVIGIVSGLLAAFTTSFPGGQIPSILDKFISLMFLYIVAKNINKKSLEKMVNLAILFFISTVISGLIFLLSAIYLVDLPGGETFVIMFLSIVVPTAIITGIFGALIYKILQKVR